MTKLTQRQPGTRFALQLGWGCAIATALALGGCDDISQEPVANADAGLGSESLLATAELALGPADGDFSECESVVYEEEFPSLPDDLQIVDGRLQLAQATETSPDVWIANSASNTVSRIDGRNGLVVNTYSVGSSPSRTTIDFDFDMYVANRNDGSVMKYDAGATCTTGGCTNTRLWTVTPFNTTAGTRGLAVDREGTLWVGAYGGSFQGYIARLRSDNGAVLELYDLYQLTRTANGGVPSSRRGIYGHVLDRDGLLWAATLSGGIMCFDTNTRASCGYLEIPGSCSQSYGVTIDGDQNVWFGTWTCNALGYINRASFDAAYRAGTGVFPNNSNTTVEMLTRTEMSNTRGVAIDPNGVVWIASSGTNRLQRYSSRSGTWLSGTTTCSNPVGVGLDNQNHVWTNCINSDQARAYDFAGAEVYRTAVQDAPYSYSDFTGYVARNFTASNGTWRRTYGPDECDGGLCTFDYLEFDGLIPEGSSLNISYRTSDDGFVWSPYSTPSDTTPRFITPAGTAPKYVEIVIQLESSPSGESPSIASFEIHRCPQMNAPTNFTIDSRYIVNQAANNYGMRWRFTDMSWPEDRFEVLDENGIIRCIEPSTTARGMGATYSGNSGATPGCVEEFLVSNTQFTRAVRGQRIKLNGATEYTPLSDYVSYYSAVNNPTSANSDMRFPYYAPDSIRLRWCRPQNNAYADLTGALIERSTDPSFSTAHPSYTIVSSWDDADRGYASATGACGEITDGGLTDNTTYYYRLTYRNGDGIPSQPLVLSQTTPNASCCYLGICVGVCINGVTGINGVCEAPPAYETVEVSCDGNDNDCDGLTDEGLLNACGTCGPAPVEVCDGVDNDCDGVVDNNPINGVRYYADNDRDGWGDTSTGAVLCSRPTNWVTIGGDCDDSNPDVNPGRTSDPCNGIDDDCDGTTDEDDPPEAYYVDSDGDNYGTTSSETLFCVRPPGYTATPGDCDDTRNIVYPGATELCDGLDNDCDGNTDENYADADIEVLAVDILTEVGDLATFCDNTYGQNVCTGGLGVTVRVNNTGLVPIPATSDMNFFKGALNTPPVSSRYTLGEVIAPGASAEFTYCFGYVFSATPVNIHARLNPPGQQACDVLSGFYPSARLSDGLEVCDGVDNDCDGVIDEAVEACGGGLECVRQPDDTYICAGTLGE